MDAWRQVRWNSGVRQMASDNLHSVYQHPSFQILQTIAGGSHGDGVYLHVSLDLVYGEFCLDSSSCWNLAHLCQLPIDHEEVWMAGE